MKNNDHELARTLDLLNETESLSLQAYVDSAGSVEVSEGVKAAADLLAQIGLSGPSPTVRPELKDRLRRRIAETKRSDEIQVWRRWDASAKESEDGAQIIRAADDFESTGVDGVFVRRLHVDRQADQATMLVRMEPGSSYPAHRHAGRETCYVLEGDLAVGQEKMAAGDFQHVAQGEIHVVQSTERGCLLLITSSLNDELLS